MIKRKRIKVSEELDQEIERFRREMERVGQRNVTKTEATEEMAKFLKRIRF